MSDGSTAALIEQVQQTRVDNDIIFGLAALVFFEYAVTLEDEIDMIWRKRWNAATILFMVNRYLMIVYNAVGLVIPTTSESCSAVQIALDILTVLQFLVSAAFATLRIYAIWDRSIPLSVLILLLNLIPFVINTYDFASDTIGFFVDPIAGPQCFETSKLSKTLSFKNRQRRVLIVSLSTRIALIAADALVMILTWVKTFGIRSKAAQQNVRTPFITCIIRDGTLYFFALLMMNIAQIIMKEFPEFSAFPPTILFINSLTPVLISRFLLNLRSVGSTVRSQGTTEEASLAVSTMFFNERANPHAQSKADRFIGPMGDELEDGTGSNCDMDGNWSAGGESEGSGSSDYRSDEEAHKYEAPLGSQHDSGKMIEHERVYEVIR